MYSHKRTLWPDMERWRAQAAASEGGVFTLPGGTLAVADATGARDALLGPAENHVRESAFLRLGRQTLTERQRTEAVQGLLTVLGRHDGARTTDVHRLIAALGGGGGRLAHQGWGVRAVHAHFAGALAHRRSAEMSRLINTYVCDSTIASAVVGRAKWRTRRTEHALRERFAEHLRRLPVPEGEPNDVIDVVLALDGEFSTLDRAQLLQRLILSTVGFTGITLEWAILLAYQSGRDGAELTEAEARTLVQEALRLYPTAWRLWRVAEKPHQIGGCPVDHGGDVLIDLHAIHRSAVWDEPDAFDPDRWSRATREQRAAYLPFGKGEQMCPANGFALRALEELCLSILRDYRGEVHVAPGRRPHARTLLAPPRGWAQVARRAA